MHADADSDANADADSDADSDVDAKSVFNMHVSRSPAESGTH